MMNIQSLKKTGVLLAALATLTTTQLSADFGNRANHSGAFNSIERDRPGLAFILSTEFNFGFVAQDLLQSISLLFNNQITAVEKFAELQTIAADAIDKVNLIGQQIQAINPNLGVAITPVLQNLVNASFQLIQDASVNASSAQLAYDFNAVLSPALTNLINLLAASLPEADLTQVDLNLRNFVANLTNTALGWDALINAGGANFNPLTFTTYSQLAVGNFQLAGALIAVQILKANE